MKHLLVAVFAASALAGCMYNKVAEDGLVFYCTFDNEAAVSEPAVGPKGKFLGATFQEGKVGQAMLATVAANNATFELPPNFLGTAGCIEFWAKIRNPSDRIGSGGDPRLFTITQKDTKNTIFTIDIVSNNGAGNAGFSAWTILGNIANIRGCHSLKYKDLFPGSNCRDWHHYAIVWNEEGILELNGNPRYALLIDGKLIPDIQGHYRPIEKAMPIIATPMLLSFTHDPSKGPSFCTKSPFLIDEFKIWDYAKTQF